MIAGALLIVTGCTSGSRPGRSNDASETADRASVSSSFVWGYEREFSSYNLNTVEGSTVGNIIVLNGVQPGFYVFGPDGSVIPRGSSGPMKRSQTVP